MSLSIKDISEIKYYNNHPRSWEFKGFVKENSTGDIFPYLDVFVADNEPWSYTIMHEDGHSSVIDADCCSVLKI
ncbi:hypothetical protein [Bacillus vallismortis]|uniref:hypothetical protein n=1 Tax=Bacillus vallismortis TaxID=72361 RepID=UPI00227F695C|nr:hypothetical protein [Bacillus vallismortis]MCY8546625.1 hypothetical protein [Bacillus vallismortis]